MRRAKKEARLAPPEPVEDETPCGETDVSTLGLAINSSAMASETPTPELKQAMAQYLSAYPSCRSCGSKATLVELKDRTPERRFDRTNFEALCEPCRDSRREQHEKD